MILNTNVALRRKRYKYQVCFPSTHCVIRTERTLKAAREWGQTNFAGTGVTYFIQKVAA